MKKLYFIIIFLLITTSLGAIENSNPVIAVLEFSQSRAQDDSLIEDQQNDLGKTLSDLFASKLSQSKAFKVVTRTNIDKLLEEQRFQTSGLTTEDNAVEIAQLVNASYVAIGSLVEIGSLNILSVQIIEVESGQIIGGNEIQYDKVEDLYEKLSSLTQDLVKNTTGENVKLKENKIEDNTDINYISLGFGITIGVGLDEYQTDHFLGGAGFNIQFKGLLNKIFGIFVGSDFYFAGDFDVTSTTFLFKIGPYLRVSKKIGLYPFVNLGLGSYTYDNFFHDEYLQSKAMVTGYGAGLDFLVFDFFAPYIEISTARGDFPVDTGKDFSVGGKTNMISTIIGISFYM